MTDTTRFGIPLPEDADSPNGPAQLQALAERVEVLLGRAGAMVAKSVIATEQSKTTTTFDYLGTPDRVQAVPLQADGLLFVVYEALVKTANVNAQAALFLNDGTTDSQLKVAGGSSPGVQFAGLATGAGSANYGWLTSAAYGLGFGQQPSGDAIDVTTPVTIAAMIPGVAFGPEDQSICVIRAPAGTYDVGVKFKAGSSGQAVSAKSRKLWVWTKDFA